MTPERERIIELIDEKIGLEARLAMAVEALENIFIGGNHLASSLIYLLGADDDTFPPYGTDPKDAMEVIEDPIKYDLWMCWMTMMRERDKLDLDAPTTTAFLARIEQRGAAKELRRLTSLEIAPDSVQLWLSNRAAELEGE